MRSLRFYRVLFLTLCLYAAASAQVKLPQLPVYVEDSQAAQDMIEQAQALRGQNRLAEAAAAFQQVIERYPSKLITAGPKSYIDARREAFREIAVDAELLAAYRQLCEPAAQRALAAAGPTDLAALEALRVRYGPCAAALEAGLRLAALELERARPADAAAVLDELEEHPDLASHEATWHLLEAAAGVFGDEPAHVEKHEAALRKLGDAKAQAQLAAWKLNRHLPTTPVVYDSMDQLPAARLPALAPKPLWQMALPDVAGIESARAMLGRNVPNEQDPGSLLRPRPVASGPRLYINIGTELRALDALSGRLIWSYENADPLPNMLNPWLRYRALVSDQRGVMVDGDRLVAVVGFALPNMVNRGAGTALVSLSAADGKVSWRIEPKDVDASLVSGFFHGTPIADHGRVLAMIRRSQMSGFQDAYVVALDAATGKMIWKRYLSSAIASNRGSGGSTQMLLSSGRLYVADGLGVAACIDSRSGSMQWLTLLPGQPNQIDLQSGVPSNGSRGEVERPVLVAAGLIVPGNDPTGAACLLDPTTGKKIRELKDAEWTGSDYLTSAGSDVLSVGPTIYLIDGKTLKVKWSRFVSAVSPSISLGRSAVLADRVLVPQRDRVVVLNLADGEMLEPFPVESAGSVLVMQDQLVLADGASVRSYMDWSKAYARLKEDAARSLTDPMPGLALTHLALHAGEKAAALEGADLALAAIQHLPADAPETDAQRQHVFDQLLRFTSVSETPDVEMRQAIFDRLAKATATPADEVAYQLAFGAFLAETGKAEDAVEHYQAVLADPTLASQIYQKATTSRQAGLEARVRLAALVKEAGPKVYEHFESLAAQRLAALIGAASPDSAALIELARQYPLAHAAPGALLAAAEALAAAGDKAGALNQLRRTYAYDTAPELLPRVVGDLAELSLSTNHTRDAKRWLERARREHPEIQPLRDGKPVAFAAWLDELAKQPSGETPLPNIKTPLCQPRVLPVRLLTPIVQSEDAWPRDRVVTYTEGKVQLRTGESLDIAWEAEVPAGSGAVALLSLTRTQALFWLDQSNSLLPLDAKTGQPAWPRLDAKATLAELGEGAPRPAAATPDERRFLEIVNPGMGMFARRPRAAQEGPGYMVRANDAMICLADRTGRIVGIDRHTGRVLWRLLAPMDQLNTVEINDDTLVLAGMSGMTTDAPSGAIVVLDAMTGEPRLPTLDDRRPILWAGVGADGLLLRVTPGEIVANHLADASVAWRLVLQGEGAVPLGSEGGELLFIQEGADKVLAIDTATGQIVTQLTIATSPAAPKPRIRMVEETWHVLTVLQEIAINPDGKIKWRDAVLASPEKQFLRQLIGETRVAVVSMTHSPRTLVVQEINGVVIMPPNQPIAGVPVLPGGASWSYNLYLFDRQTGTLTYEQPIGPLAVPLDTARSVFLDNQIILTTATATIVIPGGKR